MSSPSRTAQFTKIHKVLKKYYKPVTPEANRSVLEHLLYACCLENAPYEVAEESFLALVHNFFDWNEVRVSTARELSEVMARLPESGAAANRVKSLLQSVFEANYSFDLEELRKLNLGTATEHLTKLKGTTPFVVAYGVQAALGGHSIPLDAGTLGALQVLDVVSDQEVKTCTVAGLERAIPKPKGQEFASLLHQLGADFVANPYAPSLHEILLEINPEVRDRLPKRRKPSEVTPEPEEKPAAKKEAKGVSAGSEKEEAKAKRAPAKKKADEAKAAKGKAEAKTAKERKKETPAAKKTKAEAKETPTKKKPAAAKKESPAKKKDAAEKDKSRGAAAKKEAGKEPGSSGLAKRKPR